MDLMAYRIYAERTLNDKRDTSVYMKLMDGTRTKKTKKGKKEENTHKNIHIVVHPVSLMTYAHPLHLFLYFSFFLSLFPLLLAASMCVCVFARFDQKFWFCSRKANCVSVYCYV